MTGNDERKISSLSDLPLDIAPARDLWQGIEARLNVPAFAICLPRTSKMTLNWLELDLSIRSKQRTIG